MTVQNTNRKDVYLTNGTTVYWPYTFEIFTTDGSDLALYETNLTTGETVLIDTNLTRDIINSRIKYPRTGSPRPAGYKITVARVTERTQGANLQTQTFDPKNMERGLDKLTAMVQEIDETVSRAAVADISQQGASFTFPSPVGGKVIGWNAEGTGLINLDNTTLGIEAQMLAATEAAQDAADAIVNILEPDGTTVKKATHATSADSATLAEAAKGDTRFQISGCLGTDGSSLSSGQYRSFQVVHRNIPAGKSLKIKRVGYSLSDITGTGELRLYVFYSNTLGSAWTSSGSDQEETPDWTIGTGWEDAEKWGSVYICIKNSAETSKTPYGGCGWWLDLAIE
jgi:hypothetical protein